MFISDGFKGITCFDDYHDSRGADNKPDDALEINFRMIRFNKKIEKAEKREQEFINKNELDIKLNNYLSLTAFGGSHYRTIYPTDGQAKRQRAFDFLSLFTHKKSDTPTDNSEVTEETSLLTPQDL